MKNNLNRAIGWALLIAGLAWAARMDAWSLGEPSLSASAVAARILMRHTLVILLLTGLLQLLVGHVASFVRGGSATLTQIAWLTGAGALAYAVGSIAAPRWTASLWLLPTGAALGLAGFLLLWRSLDGAALPEHLSVTLRGVLPVICFGMALDAAMSAAIVLPTSALADYLGPADGLRLRMLRLSRVAASALPMLAYLYVQTVTANARAARAIPLGRRAMVAGAAGMTLLLFLSATVAYDLKYLLTLPVTAVVLGTCIAFWQTWQAGLRLISSAWLLMALSMVVGQWMGTFAFDGPFAAPAFLGAYSDFSRQLIRAAHTNGILFGMVGICAAMEMAGGSAAWRQRAGMTLFAVGALAAIGTEALRASGSVSAGSLAMGPAMAAIGLALVVLPLSARVEDNAPTPLK